MEKKHIITIGGRPGSGKSTTAREVANLLSYTHFSGGDYMRNMGLQRGLTIKEISILAETDPSIDKEVDDKLCVLKDTTADIVIDARMAFHWIPNSFKVYLDISREEAAQRIFNDQTEMRVASRDGAKNVEEMLENIEGRMTSERKRYKKLYDTDPYDPSCYDLVVDTTDAIPGEVAEKIVTTYKNWLT